jgi:hypothetical protein
VKIGNWLRTFQVNIELLYCAGDKIENNELGGACSTYGVQGFGGNLK